MPDGMNMRPATGLPLGFPKEFGEGSCGPHLRPLFEALDKFVAKDERSAYHFETMLLRPHCADVRQRPMWGPVVSNALTRLKRNWGYGDDGTWIDVELIKRIGRDAHLPLVRRILDLKTAVPTLFHGTNGVWYIYNKRD